MAQHDVLLLNETVPQLQEPQAGDTYRMPADVEIVGNLTISGTVDGADVAATAALAASATQPGDNLSTLVNDILASQAEAEAGTNNTKMMTPLRVAQAIAILAAGLKNKLDAVNAPTTTNDDSEGYAVGSFWVDVINDESYRCVDATTNLAVWVKTTLQTSDLATVALSGDSDDLVEGAVQLLLTSAERTKLGYLTVTGAVDLDANNTKLATVEANAKDDQTGAEIKALYEAESDTNAFTDAEKAKLGSLLVQTLTTGIVAWPTGGQANAIQLGEGISVVTTVGSSGDSVKLPTAVANARCVVINRGSAELDLFPSTGDQIEDNAVNTAISVGVNYNVSLIAIDATTWVIL